MIKSIFALITALALASFAMADTAETAANSKVADGKTYLIIGQTFRGEFQSYVDAVGKAPAGSSHYGEIYSGNIDQGDDGKDQAFLNWIGQTYPNAVVEVGISIKDNPAAGSYGSLDTTPNCVHKALLDVAAGKWDAKIDKFASTFKSFPHIKFLVRIDYEVSLGMHANKSTTLWGDILNKYASQGINILEDPSKAPEVDLSAYKDAFNHTARRIRQTDGVKNAEFVFHPVRGFGDCRSLYPGDEFVDWIGFSVFNNDVSMDCLEANGVLTKNGTGILDDNLKKCLEWAKGRKPIMICESAFQTPFAGHTAATFKDYLGRVFRLIDAYDVKAFVYINSDWKSHNWTLPWGDSRVEANSEVKEYWLRQVTGPRFIHYNGSSSPSK